MAKKGEMPDMIFVGPIGHGKQKMRFVHVVFSIEEWDENGVPRKLTLRGDKEVMDTAKIVESGVEFMTAYIPEIMLVKKPTKANKKAKDIPLN